jgi:serine/threonine protein kinase
MHQNEPVGQQIGDYRLLGRLGKGSFGTVYKAEYLHDHNLVAIKVLQIQLTSRKDLYEDCLSANISDRNCQ